MILDFGDEYKSHFFDVKGTDRNVSNFLILDEKQVGIDSGEVRTSCWRTSSAGPEVPTAAVPDSEAASKSTFFDSIPSFLFHTVKTGL